LSKRGKSFAAIAASLPAGLPDHDAILSPDTMTTLFINHSWRRLISDTLQTYADSIIAKLDDSLVDDYRNQFQALLDDLYTMDMTQNTVFTVERTTTSFALNHSAWQPIPVDAGKDPNNAFTFPTGFIKITEGGLYSVRLLLSVRNAATAGSNKLCRLRNRTQNLTACIGVSKSIAASAIERSWLAIDDIFECDSGDEFEFEIYSVASNATIESDGTIGSIVSRCLVGEFQRIS